MSCIEFLTKRIRASDFFSVSWFTVRRMADLWLGYGRATSLVATVCAAIALPTVCLALLGRWLDRRFLLSWPAFTLIGLALALAIVTILVVYIARRAKGNLFSSS
jgi:hypothetical protein